MERCDATASSGLKLTGVGTQLDSARDRDGLAIVGVVTGDDGAINQLLDGTADGRLVPELTADQCIPRRSTSARASRMSCGAWVCAAQWRSSPNAVAS